MSTLLVVREGGPPRPLSAVELGQLINQLLFSIGETGILIPT